MIHISHLSKTYSQGKESVSALDDVSLTVNSGDIFGVVGPSGAGKSTLIRCVNFLERPTSGSVVVNGKDLNTLSTSELRRARQKIGMIFQHFNLLSSRTVSENVGFPLEILKVGKEKRRKKVNELLDVVGLSEKANAYPSQLSGGQKQRVGIARALATDPEILLSDEATSALDPENTSAILELLKELNRNLGLTILLITHEMEVVKQVCKTVAFLKEGRICEQGKLMDLLAMEESIFSKAIFSESETRPVLPGATRVEIIFIGETADKPVLTSLVRKFEIEINIIGGNIQTIAGTRVGKLEVELSGPQVLPAINYLRELGLRLKVF